IHNDHLRMWLREPHSTDRTKLAHDVLIFLERFSDVLNPNDESRQPASAAPSVVVSVLPAGADEQSILDAVAKALRERQH
ncbi:MAG: hypothetical protein WAK06_08095, partial [Glutamicibacter protophormiae]